METPRGLEAKHVYIKEMRGRLVVERIPKDAEGRRLLGREERRVAVRRDAVDGDVARLNSAAPKVGCEAI